MALRIEELNDANCKTYLLTSGTSAALVDPVRERVERYLETLRAQALTLELILETHTHADHLMIGREAKHALGAPVLMHRESPSPVVDEHVDEGTEIPLGRDLIKVLHTPGHTPDSVSYVCGTAVLTGDVLLIGGSGRTDFAGGDPGASYDSVTTKLFRLADHFVVWPAHDYKGRTSSTIGEEKRTNPRFAAKSRDEYIALMNNLALSLPERVQQVLQVNQSGFEAEEVGGFPLVTDAATVPGIDAHDVARELRGARPPLVIDVREPEEFVSDLGHIEGALLIPMDALLRRLPKLAGYVDRNVVVVCRAGARSRSACAILRTAGFQQVRNLEGGMLAWAEARLPVSR
jgi:glyoxylase-like metal-dependent hydrolase (beta-lactamase superfamily II)/rhodanese-related sulfurtransferase